MKEKSCFPFLGEVLVFIHTQFENKVNNRRKSIALIMNDSTLTYEELNCLSNKIAHALLNQGVSPGEIVGLCFERSFELIAGILALMKVGAAYLPLDTEYPIDRIKFMMSHSRASKVLVHRKLATLFKQSEVTSIIFEDINLESFDSFNPNIDLTKSNLSYVIYTSGATGQPKGIAMGARPLINLIDWQNKQGSLGEDSITLQYTPVSFDVHFQEIFSTLTSGGKLILITEQQRLDTLTLLKTIEEKKVNKLFLPYVALNHLCEVGVNQNIFPKTLKEITTAGEQLKISRSLRHFIEKLDGAVLYNHYGPSETHVVTCFPLTGNPNSWPNLPSIGRPIQNVDVLILDKDLNEVKSGEEGEIFLGGDCLAEGYLHSEQMTAVHFIQTQKWGRLYRTGDLAYMNSENNFVFMGRKDSQIKMRGYRIELGEIELAIEKSFYGGPCAVNVIEDGLESYLCAYVNGLTTYDNNKLREELRSTLPEFMVPSYFIKINKIPLTPSGKIDYKNLPALSNDRPLLVNDFEAAFTPSQSIIEQCWKKYLKVSPLGIDDSFFDIGGNSLMAIKILAEINQHVKKKISVVNFFQYPTIRMLAKFIDEKNDLLELHNVKKDNYVLHHEIAVIAVNGKFPGANNIEEFWDILISQRNPLEEFALERINQHIRKEAAADPNYVRMQGIYPGQEFFDYQFFGIAEVEAELMDPQQRKFLELSYNAIELAGYSPDKLEGKVGVYAGMGNSKYHRLVDLFPDKFSQLGEFNVMLGLEKDYIATRVAYKMNLKGPAVSIHTGCSTSLVSIIEAVKSLRLSQCDMAIAGGIAIYGAPNSGHLYESEGIFSEDGLCRSFDDRASGTLFTEGGGVVVLKRLDDAKQAGDNILAVIKGVGINNDGSEKISFTAPSVIGQSLAIAEAHMDAGIKASTVGYVETHGAGTMIGDPIEVEALSRAFERTSEQKQFCYLSSVKSNIGHLTAAAGVASFIKSVLILKNGVIPGTAHFETPNHNLTLENTPFIISRNAHTFPDLIPSNKRAGVSSFGVGGTNAHIILEDFPNKEAKEELVEELESPAFFKISAKTSKQVEELKLKLIHQLAKTPKYEWKKIAYTLDVGRKAHKVRDYLLLSDYVQLAKVNKTLSKKKPKKEIQGLALMFGGRGSQYPGMGRDLYLNIDYFREQFDECNRLISPHLGFDLRNFLHQSNMHDEMENIHYYLPSIFLVEYCLAKTFIQLGYKVEGLYGNDIGEFVAATVAGIFPIEDALKTVAQLSNSNEIEFEKNLRSFELNMSSIPKDSSLLFIEIGTSNIEESKKISLLGDQHDFESHAFLQALGELWNEGINYSNPTIIHHSRDQKRRIAPVYPFLKNPCWLGPYNDHQPRKLHTEVKTMNDERLSTLKDKLTDLFENGTGIAVNVFNDPREPGKVPNEFPIPSPDTDPGPSPSPNPQPIPGPSPLSPGEIPGRIFNPMSLSGKSDLRDIIARQLELMNQQLALLAEYSSTIKESAISASDAVIAKQSLEEQVRFTVEKTAELTQHKQEVHINEHTSRESKFKYFDPTRAPVIGAKIGRDEQGNPAWFIENPEKTGEFFLLEG
jgi:amino acid adenylation domain-containing protein